MGHALGASALPDHPAIHRWLERRFRDGSHDGSHVAVLPTIQMTIQTTIRAAI
jgi:hypothetical protein